MKSHEFRCGIFNQIWIYILVTLITMCRRSDYHISLYCLKSFDKLFNYKNVVKNPNDNDQRKIMQNSEETVISEECYGF